MVPVNPLPDECGPRLPSEGRAPRRHTLSRRLTRRRDTLQGDGPFDREAARSEFERVRGLLGQTYSTDNVSEVNLEVTAELIEAEDRLGSVEVLRRRADVGNKFRSWARAIHDVERPGQEGGTS